MRRVISWLATRAPFLLVVLLISVAVLLSWFLVAGFSPQIGQAALAVAAITALFAAISAVASLLQTAEAQRLREAHERPSVHCYFDGASNGIIYVVLHNVGASPATDLTVKFDPAPSAFRGRHIDELSLFRDLIRFMPAGRVHRQPLDAGHRFFSEGRPTAFKVKVSYSSLAGQHYTDEFVHDLEYLRDATLPGKTVEDLLERVAKALDQIAGKLG